MTRRSPRSVSMRLVWRLRKLLEIETELWNQGYTRVAGVDEVGVGPLAGPVVAAAVVFRPGCGIKGVDDSKRLLPEQRQRVGDAIRSQALCFGIAEVAPADIDRLNIYQAAREAMRLAVAALPERPDYVIVDARTVPGCELPQRAIVGGDARCHAIAAASILAKLARDAVMVQYEAEFPGYGFAHHKGYATLSHRQALARLGPCAIHRRSFTPCVQGSLWDLDALDDASMELTDAMPALPAGWDPATAPAGSPAAVEGPGPAGSAGRPQA